MKKLLCFLAAALLVFSLTACVDNETADEGAGNSGNGLGNDIWWSEDGLETPILPG